MEENNITSTKKSSLISLIRKNSIEVFTVSTTPAITTSKEDDNNYILMPLFSGLFVALLLLWMLYRYTATNEQRSHHDGAIYCCPQGFFDIISRCFECRKSHGLKNKNLDLPQQNVYRYVDDVPLNSIKPNSETTPNMIVPLVESTKSPTYQGLRHNSSFRIPDNLKGEVLNNSFYHSFNNKDSTFF